MAEQTTEEEGRLMDGNATGKALAFASGDYRDWPLACAECGSEEVSVVLERDVLRCAACRCETTRHIAMEYQHERASREVLGHPRKPTFPFRPKQPEEAA